jgi:transposase, IS605 OrfB family, central region
MFKNTLSGGKKKGKSKRTERHQDNDATTATQLSIFHLLNQPSSTPELAVEVKKPTFFDRLTFFCLATPDVKLSKTSGVVSISKEKVLLPYWNKFTQVTSEWLSLPQKIDCVGSDSMLSHGLRSGAGVRFWFSTIVHLVQNARWLKIYSPLSTATVADCTDSESIKSKSLKTLTYRVYPKGETKKVWMLRIHANRKVYNNAIAYLNQNQGKFTYYTVDKKTNQPVLKTSGKQAFRSFCKTLGYEIIPEWCKELGIAHGLDNALFEAYTAWKKTDKQPAQLGKGKNAKPNPLVGLKLARFRSIRAQKQTIQFDPGDYKSGHLMANASKNLEKPLWTGQDYCLINYDKAVEVTYNKGRWFVNMPVEMDIPEPKNGGKAIAIDPGLRCFLTGFNGNSFTDFGKYDFGKIARLCQHLDKMQSKLGRSKGGEFSRLRYRLRQAMEKVRTRIKNLRSEIHKQVASYLARNYDIIYLPTFETSQMVARGSRKLNSKSARAMMTWAFYQFSQTLEHLCNRYGSRLVRVTEEYTSKTCTKCGHIQRKLGGSKTFRCPNCGYEIPRDFNGALGIFLKALWDTTILSDLSDECAIFRFSPIVGDCLD